MNLRNILIGLEYNTYVKIDNEFRYEFYLRVAYISNYFSREIRKYKFKTDGSYNTIAIDLIEPEIRVLNYTKIVPFNVLSVEIPFNRSIYNEQKNNCNYYLNFFKEGFIKASKFKPIPLEFLLDLIKKFRNKNCLNLWIHKKRKSKKDNLEIILTCNFTSEYFQLIITIYKLSTNEKLLSEIILQTEPDPVLFEGMFNDVMIKNDSIIITDKTGCSRIIINKNNALKGILKCEIIGDKEIKKILTFGLNNPCA